MASKIYIKETDNSVTLSLKANLAGSVVRVIVRSTSSDVALPDLPVTILNAATGTLVVTTSSLAVGSYFLEVEQNQAGKLYHYPNKGYVILIVSADLDASVVVSPETNPVLDGGSL